jgi:3,4-dihydroxy-9,10-secoandrosta-1,3,5(10)-triene-9,17-dione 4,5-dioxygenase
VGLGYALIAASDLSEWKAFAVDLLGLQIAQETDDRLLLRMDEKSYRLDIRRDAGNGGVTTLGWEVVGPRELVQLSATLEAAGFVVKPADAATIAERMVSGLSSFHDPDGVTLELYWGLKTDKNRFVSPTGARFKTGTGGFGHAFQMVSDEPTYRRLYEDLLGFRLSDYIDFAPGVAGTFLHCNPRHHSFAHASIPGVPNHVNHLMFEVDDFDLVGRAWDKVLAGAAPVAASFGKHSNDEMLSFYVKTPSGFQVEYGYGGRILDSTYTPTRYDVASYWGHKQSDPDQPDI